VSGFTELGTVSARAGSVAERIGRTIIAVQGRKFCESSKIYHLIKNSTHGRLFENKGQGGLSVE
jgi:hypothetical protein